MDDFLVSVPVSIKELILNVKSPSNSKILNYVAKEEDLRILKTAAIEHVGQKTNSVLESCMVTKSQKPNRITFGCKALDECSQGGIAVGGITEITGDSACGKTQLLLQLCITTQLPVHMGGLDKGVVFITTKNKQFQSKRLTEIGQHFDRKYSNLGFKYMSNIFLEHTKDKIDLLDCITSRIPKLMINEGIGLIIIDSIDCSYGKMSQDLRKLTHAMLDMIFEHKCGIVCVNEPNARGNHVHFGRTRLKISKIPKQIKVKDQLLTVRKFEIMFSPDSPNENAEFLITSNGVCDVIRRKLS